MDSKTSSETETESETELEAESESESTNELLDHLIKAAVSDKRPYKHPAVLVTKSLYILAIAVLFLQTYERLDCLWCTLLVFLAILFVQTWFGIWNAWLIET